jgi:hypothetical protein
MKRLIPFKFLPAAWGLKGKTRARAEIEYYYTGYERAEKLLHLDLEGDSLERAVIDLKHEYNLIDSYEHETLLAKHGPNSELAVLEVEYKYNKISDRDYEKQKATLNAEPWVTVLDMDFDPDDPSAGAMQLDWNDAFIDFLHGKGYALPTPEDTVNAWLNDVCRNIALDAFDGIGDINERLGGLSPEESELSRIDPERYFKG